MRTVLARPHPPNPRARRLRSLAAPLALTMLLASCGDDGGSAGDAGAAIVVTTTTLGDVVRNLVGDDAPVDVGIPPHPPPHPPNPRARRLRSLAAPLALTMLLASCGDDGGSAGDAGAEIVVTTTILGDVVRNLVGDDASVDVVMPPNASPHDFAPSAKQAAALRSADVVVANGLGFESGLVAAVDAAADDGATVLHATDYVETAPFRANADHEDEHADEDHEDEHGAADDHADHDHDGDDTHLFTAPARMATIAEGLAADLMAAVPELRSEEHTSE